MATIFAHAAFLSGIASSALEHSLFFDCVFCKVSHGQWPVRGNGVQPLPSDSALFPFTYTLAKEGKQIWHIVTYNGSGCRSDVVQIMWDFQETSLLSKCSPLHQVAEQLSFQQSCFCLLLSQKDNVLAILVAAAELAHTSTLAPNTST
jgi:hypothetical protein